jgi:hypothetical protein
MAKSYRIDAKSKILKANGDDQIPYGDSVISSDHLERCSKKGEASIIAKMGISDKRSEKAKQEKKVETVKPAKKTVKKSK